MNRNAALAMVRAAGSLRRAVIELQRERELEAEIDADLDRPVDLGDAIDAALDDWKARREERAIKEAGR